MSPETVELDITGMTCAACSSRIEKVLNKMDGVQNATVNLTTEQAKVDYYPEETDADKLVTRIQKLGYDASIKDNNKDQTSRKAEALQHKLIAYHISSIIFTTINVNVCASFQYAYTSTIYESMVPIYFSYTCTIYYWMAILCRCLLKLKKWWRQYGCTCCCWYKCSIFYSIYEMVRWLNGSTTQTAFIL